MELIPSPLTQEAIGTPSSAQVVAARAAVDAVSAGAAAHFVGSAAGANDVPSPAAANLVVPNRGRRMSSARPWLLRRQFGRTARSRLCRARPGTIVVAAVGADLLLQAREDGTSSSSRGGVTPCAVDPASTRDTVDPASTHGWRARSLAAPDASGSPSKGSAPPPKADHRNTAVPKREDPSSDPYEELTRMGTCVRDRAGLGLHTLPPSPRSRQVTEALSAASELQFVSLAEALELTLLLAENEAEKYERAAVQWHLRFGQEVPHVDPPREPGRARSARRDPSEPPRDERAGRAPQPPALL